METTAAQSSVWYQALTLAERMTYQSNPTAPPKNGEIDSAMAEKRLQHWLSQAPFTAESYFEQRLALDGLTKAEFRALLAQPPEVFQARVSEPPGWLIQITQAFSSSEYAPASPDHSSQTDDKDAANGPGFLYVIAPLIRQGQSRLREGIRALSRSQANLPFDPQTIENILFAGLPIQLFNVLNRTLVLEMHIARLRGLLSGDTPEARFLSFANRLRQPEVALEILQEYPVLARQIVVKIEQWIETNLEFLRHLCTDWEEICNLFNSGHNPGPLVQVNGSAADRHRGGRTVLLLRFNSGFRIVYKPKATAVDVHFQELLTWLNKRGNHPPFRTIKVLDRGSYGWAEFVSSRSCESPSALQRFYERQGGYLALLYALAATDFHYENLIASGEHPILIDLESLFHPHMRSPNTAGPGLSTNKVMANSVLTIGLLPRRLYRNAENDGVDISGLGARSGQLTPRAVPYWENVGTDEMLFTRKRVEIKGLQNRPTLDENQVNVLDYSEAITAGFTHVYHLLLEHRQELLADDGPLLRFADDEVRAIIRPTRLYASLLTESYHPDVLRDALDRDRLLDRLWADVERQPELEALIAAEITDLQQGDIPMFTTYPNSRHVWSSRNEQISDFFDESGMSLVRERLNRLSQEDFARQLWFIQASLTALAMGESHNVQRLLHHQHASSNTTPPLLPARDRLIEAAQNVGERLAWLALEAEDEIAWLGLTLVHDRHWVLSGLGPDLYNGLPGVALFLAYLGQETQNERYTNLAQVALQTVQRGVKSGWTALPIIGGFTGWGGLIYTFTHLGVLWRQPQLVADAEAFLAYLPPLIERDECLDIVAGAAGCIITLLHFYRHTSSEQALDLAIQCGEHLIAQGQPMTQGIGWQPPMGGRPLAGFSHGAAGIAWALTELAAVTGETRFQEAALAGIAYERHLFSPEAGNWPDLRQFDHLGKPADNNQSSFMSAWCHGAPGIGLARLQMLKHRDGPNLQHEIDIALKTTLAQGFGRNHSLCHGDLGNLELLLQASLVLDDPQWQDHLAYQTTRILDSIDQHGWLCGVPLNVETPGLMTGLAGIGYELLRLADPGRVPSVLLLEPPGQPVK